MLNKNKEKNSNINKDFIIRILNYFKNHTSISY